MRKHVTLIYTVNDEAAFRDEWSRLHSLMTASHGKPFAITAISFDHEMRRVQLIEEAGERYEDHHDFRDAVKEIIACADLSQWKWDDGREENAEPTP